MFHTGIVRWFDHEERSTHWIAKTHKLCAEGRTDTEDKRKVRKRAKIRNRYNQAPHLTQDTHGKVTNSRLDITNESQEVSPCPAGDHKVSINRRQLRAHKGQAIKEGNPPYNYLS